ncbi:MAG: hypothetical protein A4E59_02486 [Syntrophorhabdus sp. PtaB.Bin027]|nr:MAG: hypothetical protein A4E59_02486 [Syntrophorhabdus sp. PtaB.Bin027]OQB77930.1 MAG: hypothetical protein BWX92_00572 [Deltaproteobacteria bacterium ADurb.Bin135]HPW35568.1 hypothetical protein [Syntrophorhabdus sp.]
MRSLDIVRVNIVTDFIPAWLFIGITADFVDRFLFYGAEESFG